jgi:hypothetical protein
MAVVRGLNTKQLSTLVRPDEDWFFLIDAKGEVAAKIDSAKSP